MAILAYPVFFPLIFILRSRVHTAGPRGLVDRHSSVTLDGLRPWRRQNELVSPGEPVSSDVTLLANAEGVVMKWYACKDFAALPRPV